jgi:hypothetical protein
VQKASAVRLMKVQKVRKVRMYLIGEPENGLGLCNLSLAKRV